MKAEFHVQVSETEKIVDLLAKDSELPKQQIKQAMQKGAVWLENAKGTHRIRRAEKTANNGETVHFYYNEEILNQIPRTPELVADEGDYSVWNKPSGILSQGSKWSDHCTIHRWIETHYTFNDGNKRPCFIVHRLDKATQGLIVIAHTKSANAELCQMFEKREIEKHYYALVKGELPVKFNQHLDQEPQPKPILIEGRVDGKIAKTFVNRLHFNPEKNQSLLDIKIETGRKHQIRIHLSDYGYPLIGDRLYGKNDEDDLQLQAYFLKLTRYNKQYKLENNLSW